MCPLHVTRPRQEWRCVVREEVGYRAVHACEKYAIFDVVERYLECGQESSQPVNILTEVITTIGQSIFSNILFYWESIGRRIHKIFFGDREANHYLILLGLQDISR